MDDSFNNIINDESVQNLWQLYQTDQNIKKLCDKYSFCNVLVRFCSSDFFKQEATSILLDNTFYNYTYNDKILLKQLQFCLGSCVIGDNILSKIIIFMGLYTDIRA